MRFLTAIFGKRSEPPPQVAASLAPVLAPVPVSAPGKATGGESQFQCFHRCLKLFPHLAPRDASVGAFVAWLQELGCAGEWDYPDLLENYFSICEMTGAATMPGKWFWRGMESHSCHRWRADRDLDGYRWRPWIIYVPLVASDRVTGDVIPNGKISALRAQKQALRARSGTQRIARQSWQGREGFKHSADISSAVASQ